jgi:hypothetical protein
MKIFLIGAGVYLTGIATGLLIAWIFPAAEWVGAYIGRGLGWL